MIDFDTFTKMPKNVVDLDRLIVAKGFIKLPKVQKIAFKETFWPLGSTELNFLKIK